MPALLILLWYYDALFSFIWVSNCWNYLSCLGEFSCRLILTTFVLNSKGWFKFLVNFVFTKSVAVNKEVNHLAKKEGARISETKPDQNNPIIWKFSSC